MQRVLSRTVSKLPSRLRCNPQRYIGAMSVSNTYRHNYNITLYRKHSNARSDFSYNFKENQSKPKRESSVLPQNINIRLECEPLTPKPEETQQSPTNVLDFNDTQQIFQNFTTMELMSSFLLFQLCSSQHIINAMIKTVRYSLYKMDPNNRPHIGTQLICLPLLGIVKTLYFPLFTGGENLVETSRLASQFSDNGVFLALDHSTEETSDPEKWELHMMQKMNMIRSIADTLKPGQIKFIPLKMTSLVHPKLLEDMTKILNTERPLDHDPSPFLTPIQKDLLHHSMHRLRGVITAAQRHNLGIWLDAEQFARQPAMNYLSRLLQSEFNIHNKVWVYNTYQMYLQDATPWLQFDLDHAALNHYNPGVKLVRGAYISAENKLAAKQGRPSPIHTSKENTDAAYNDAISKVLHIIANAKADSHQTTSLSAGLAVCTHNRGSLIKMTQLMDELQLDKDYPTVFTAQLKGMCDNLTIGLGLKGYNSIKLMPYGLFEDIWPYLMRRLQENQDMLSGMTFEKTFYAKELQRRLMQQMGK